MSGGIFGAVGTVAHLAALLETAPAADLWTFASADRTGTEMKADPIADPTVDATADAVPDLPARETRAETAVAGTEAGGQACGAVEAEPATDLDLVLRSAGVTHLVFTGITADVCVHSTIREDLRGIPDGPGLGRDPRHPRSAVDFTKNWSCAHLS